MRNVVIASLVVVASTAAANPISHRIQEKEKEQGISTTERWGGGVRLTGLSGIGALPGVNFGGEVAVNVRRDEVFAELGLGRWQPEESYHVASTTDEVALKLDVWALRVGYASMQTPLRGWLLAEVGEMASVGGTVRGMSGVVPRMMMGDTPSERQWRAVGGGFGVAWPMSNQARLVGNLELAIPFHRERLMLDRGGGYEPDPIATRFAVGLEVGWR